MSSFQGPTPLLDSLERDFAQQGKVTVKDCLRSKALPDSEVRKVGNDWDTSDLQLSYYSILSSYLARIKDDMTTGKATESMWYLSRAATVFRFVQLLLERKDDDDGDSKKQRHEWTLQLIKNLVGVACTCAEQTRDGLEEKSMDTVFEGESAIETVHPIHVAIYIFGSLLRLDPYVQSKPYLLSPLWKGLCDVASSLQTPPSELLHQAFKAVVDHLQDGIGRLLEPASTVVDLKLDAFVISIVRFLVARLSTFLGMPTSAEVTKGPYGKALHVLCLATGLETILVHDALDKSLVKLYRQLSSKAEKCLLSWTEQTTMETLDNRRLAALLKVRVTQRDFKTPQTRTAVAVGKLSCYNCLLSRACKLSATQEKPWQDEDAQVVLRICEEMVVDLLPLCSANESLVPLLGRSLDAIVSTLYECEVRVPCLSSNNAQPGKRRFHYMLIKWLCGSHEVAIAAISLHVMELSTLGSDSLLRLLVKLVFDVRTESSLRRNIASLLMRLAHSKESRPKPLESLVLAEYQSLMQRSSSRKRKRSGSFLAASDLQIIALLLSSMPMTRRNQTAPTIDESSGVPTLRYATLQFSVDVDPLNILGKAPMLTRMIEQASKQRDARRTTHVVALMVTLFRRLHNHLTRDTRALPDAQLQQVLLLLQTAMSVSSGDREPALRFEAIHLLAVIGQATTSRTPKAILESQAQIFHSLLSDGSWPVRALAISSLVSYASTLPSIHKSTLPLCIPTSMQAWLQARLQGSIVVGAADLKEAKSVLGFRLACPSSKRSSAAKKLFSSSSSLTISAQSLVLMMPTQEGRSAIVIFPPGEQSRKDINFMLGQDEAGMSSLQRVEALEDGAGKLILRQEDEE